MPRKATPPRLVTLDEIRAAFQLASIGDSPPIGRRRSNNGYYIRVLAGVTTTRDGGTHTKYDYFHIAADTGAIIAAPWGHAKTYRPGYMSVGELEAAIAELNERKEKTLDDR